MSCNCKARPSRQGKKYCQHCLPDEMQWLVPVSQTPDPFLMDTNHAYITPDNKVWVLSHDRTRAYAINGSVLDNLDTTQFARVEDIIKYTAGKGIRIEGNVISSTVDLTPLQQEVDDIVTKVETNRITLDTLKTLVEALANKNKDYLPGENITISEDRVISADLAPLTERVRTLEVKPDKDTVYDDTTLKARVTALEEKPDNDTIYDDTSVRERLTALESKPDKDTKYTAGTNVTISQNNEISVDFQELLTRLQQADVFNEEQQQAINELKEATKRIRVYKQGQGIDITDDLTINGWNVTKSTQGAVENFTFVSPTGEEITLAHDNRKPTAGEGIKINDNWQISVDLSKVATKSEVNQAKSVADQAQEQALSTERRLTNFIANYTDNDTVYDDTAIKNRLVALENKPDIDTQYTAGTGLSLTGNQFKNTGQVFKLTEDTGYILPKSRVPFEQAVDKTGFIVSTSVGKEQGFPQEKVSTYAVMSHQESSQGGSVIAYDVDTGKQFIRRKARGVWGEWKEVNGSDTEQLHVKFARMNETHPYTAKDEISNGGIYEGSSFTVSGREVTTSGGTQTLKYVLNFRGTQGKTGWVHLSVTNTHPTNTLNIRYNGLFVPSTNTNLPDITLAPGESVNSIRKTTLRNNHDYVQITFRIPEGANYADLKFHIDNVEIYEENPFPVLSSVPTSYHTHVGFYKGTSEEGSQNIEDYTWVKRGAEESSGTTYDDSALTTRIEALEARPAVVGEGVVGEAKEVSYVELPNDGEPNKIYHFYVRLKAVGTMLQATGQRTNLESFLTGRLTVTSHELKHLVNDPKLIVGQKREIDVICQGDFGGVNLVTSYPMRLVIESRTGKLKHIANVAVVGAHPYTANGFTPTNLPEGVNVGSITYVTAKLIEETQGGTVYRGV